MKILFTQDALINAGTERSNLDLLSRFSGEMDVSVVYFYPRHELKEEYQRAGIRLFFLNIPEKYHLILGVRRLVRLIRREQPDLLVSSLWRADIITRLASLITGVPLVGTLVNDSYSDMAWKDKFGVKHRVVYWIDRISAGIPKFWIANAQALVDSHVKTLGIERNLISVVYRGRAVIARTRNEAEAISGWNQSFPFKTASPADSLVMKSDLLNSSLAVTNQTRNFISYGRLLERKGFQDAIQAFSQVLEKFPDCTLTIFGEGPYRKELESLILDKGLQESVFLPGKIQNPIDALVNGYCLSDRSVAKTPQTAYCQLPTPHCPLPTEDCQLKTAHCFLFPSWYEGFSGALVEAMMAGIPIISSDIPMNLEAIEDEQTALVFSLRDPQALAQKMIWAIENPEKMDQLGTKAREVAIHKFSIEKIAQQYEATLKGFYQNWKKG